jgi:hypothetical protein
LSVTDANGDAGVYQCDRHNDAGAMMVNVVIVVDGVNSNITSNTLGSNMIHNNVFDNGAASMKVSIGQTVRLPCTTTTDALQLALGEAVRWSVNGRGDCVK